MFIDSLQSSQAIQTTDFEVNQNFPSISTTIKAKVCYYFYIVLSRQTAHFLLSVIFVYMCQATSLVRMLSELISSYTLLRGLNVKLI